MLSACAISACVASGFAAISTSVENSGGRRPRSPISRSNCWRMCTSARRML
jgi:hypothetical protein